MTEAEWPACADLYRLLKMLRGRASGRKSRLFAVACCRLIAELITAEELWHALDVSERFADDRATEEERSAAQKTTRAVVLELGRAAPTPDLATEWARKSAAEAVYETASAHLFPSLTAGKAAHAAKYAAKNIRRFRADQVARLRDVYGNPFQSLAFDPAWRTDTAVAVARQMYESREFGGMPIFADALQDAGCDSDDILSHCRDTSLTHVRGCWVVDLVLGQR